MSNEIRSASGWHADTAYWVSLAILLVTSAAMALDGIPLAWLGILLTIAASIRVPLLQSRHNPESSEFDAKGGKLLPPAALLFTSLALLSVFAVVAFIAFMAVCIPGTIAFGMGDLSSSVATISGIIGFICFSLMFILSLRLRF